MDTKNFGAGFFGRMPFAGGMNDLFEKWESMSDAEKLEMMNKHIELAKEFKNGFSVEAIDKRCKDWLEKSQEEKEALLKEKMEMHSHCRGGHHHFGHFR